MNIPGNTNTVFYKSSLGTPVYTDLYISGASYTDENGTYSFTTIREPSALMKVSRKKNIIWTKINGLNSEIPEYIGAENFEIDVELKINGSNLLYPQAKVQNILTMLNSNQVLSIHSWYLNQFPNPITTVVICDEDEPQVMGDLNNQVIKFKMKAVKPLILASGGSVGNSAGNTPGISANVS